MAKRTAIKDLRAGSIEATPIEVEDWQAVVGLGDETDSNTFWEAVSCQECDAVMVFEGGSGNDRHCDLIPSASCEGYFGMAEGPMMNYWYPVDLHTVNDDPEEAARLIADLPLCVVQIEGKYGLALTGGGMDLSWEICEAYTRLGQLPPVHFCDLPGMADRMQPADSTYGAKALARDRYIMAACRESCRVQINWAKNKLRSLRELETSTKAK